MSLILTMFFCRLGGDTWRDLEIDPANHIRKLFSEIYLSETGLLATNVKFIVGFEAIGTLDGKPPGIGAGIFGDKGLG